MISEEEAEELRERLLEQVEKLPEKQAAILKEQIKKASAEELESFVKQQAQGSECFFCQIILGKVETVRIYEDADILAILDIYPANLGHMIIMPKAHFSSINEVPDALLTKLFVFIKIIAPLLMEIAKAESVSIVIAQGRAAGQTVNHFSINVIPRFEKDFSFEWPKRKVDKKELEKLGEKIRKKASKVVSESIEQEKEKHEEEMRKKEERSAEKIMKHMRERIP
ncbi:MAG: HIT family protein [Candidatus Pacearchaeota archaeon]|nr:HIT family protein [Candidatus Pacearchaeota archaeon]